MAMEFIRLGKRGATKNVHIPSELLDQYDSGELKEMGLIDYAISTGQGRPSDFGLENAETPRAAGRGNAMMIQAGAALDRGASNVRQGLAEAQIATGLRPAEELTMTQFDPATRSNQRVPIPEAERNIQSEIDHLTSPVSEEFPVSSFGGDLLPELAVPGGKLAQVGMGITEGALRGDTARERLGNAALGGVMSLVGRKAGDELTSRLGPRIQSGISRLTGNTRQQANAAARARLTSEGIPLSFGQRGSPTGQFVDVLKSTFGGGKSLSADQISRLNRLGARAIGENADDLSRETLGRAHTRIGEVYDSVATMVDDIPITENMEGAIRAIETSLQSVTDRSRAQPAYNLFAEALTNPDGLDGVLYQTTRTRLGKISQQLWKQGLGLEAEAVDDMIEVLDDGLAAAAPQAAEALSVVRPQWQALRLFRRASVLDPMGDVNPNSMMRAFERMFTGANVNKFPQGPVGDFGRTLAAHRRVIQPFRSSGTTERALGVGAPMVAAAGLSGAGVLPALAPLGVAFLGGGSGGLIGGGLARQSAFGLEQGLLGPRSIRNRQ